MGKNSEIDEEVLCGANSYNQKYFLNSEYENLPEEVKTELKRICVSFTEESGGVFLMAFGEDGTLRLKTLHDESDYLYDDIDAQLRIDRLSREKETLFAKLDSYYRGMKLLKAGKLDGLTGFSGEEGIGANNPDGQSEVIRAVSYEEQGTIRMTGSWDMPVAPDDEHAEESAYRTLFGD